MHVAARHSEELIGLESPYLVGFMCLQRLILRPAERHLHEDVDGHVGNVCVRAQFPEVLVLKDKDAAIGKPEYTVRALEKFAIIRRNALHAVCRKQLFETRQVLNRAMQRNIRNGGGRCLCRMLSGHLKRHIPFASASITLWSIRLNRPRAVELTTIRG